MRRRPTLSRQAATSCTFLEGAAKMRMRLNNFRMQDIFGKERVGLRTGDVFINADAPIVVMTTEILRNITYRSELQLQGEDGEQGHQQLKFDLAQVGLAVLDEVHWLGQPDRGTVWEELIINAPEHMQLLAMSATVSNAQELGEWITAVHGPCQTLETGWRPVPLEWYFGWDEGPQKKPGAGRSRIELLLNEAIEPGEDAHKRHRRAELNPYLSHEAREKVCVYMCAQLSSMLGAIATLARPWHCHACRPCAQCLGVYKEMALLVCSWHIVCVSLQARKLRRQLHQLRSLAQRPRLPVQDRTEAEERADKLQARVRSMEVRCLAATCIASARQSVFVRRPAPAYAMHMQCRMWSVMYMSTLVLHVHPTCSRKQSLSAKSCKVSSIVQAAAPPMREPDFLNVVMALHERKLLPAIFFVFSRHRCSQYAGAVRRQLVTNAERAEIDAELREFVAAQSEAVPAGQTDALLNGAASHHAGYLPGATIKVIGLCAPCS